MDIRSLSGLAIRLGQQIHVLQKGNEVGDLLIGGIGKSDLTGGRGDDLPRLVLCGDQQRRAEEPDGKRRPGLKLPLVTWLRCRTRKNCLPDAGAPASGKSHAARRLASQTGVVLETDQYFYLHVGNDPTVYDYRDELLPKASQWNLDRFVSAMLAGVSPIVVERGNGLNAETRQYVVLAREHSYQVELREPDSPWWQELRVLLKYKQHVSSELLDQWADALAKQSRETHRVPSKTILQWMESWRSNLPVDEILAADE
jgi:AAA domain